MKEKIGMVHVVTKEAKSAIIQLHPETASKIRSPWVATQERHGSEKVYKSGAAVLEKVSKDEQKTSRNKCGERSG